MARYKSKRNASQKNSDMQSNMAPKTSRTGASAPGSARSPGNARGTTTANERSRTPASVTGQQAYDRAFGAGRAPKPSAIRRGY